MTKRCPGIRSVLYRRLSSVPWSVIGGDRRVVGVREATVFGGVTVAESESLELRSGESVGFGTAGATASIRLAGLED